VSTIHQAASLKNRGRRRKKRLNALRSLFKSPQKKGTVFKCRIMTPKKPNSAKRKIAKVKLSNKFYILAKIKGKGPFLNKHASVLVCGGRANDLPGVRYNMVKGKFDFTWKEQFWRMHSRSKYGIKWDDYFAVLDDQLEESDIEFDEKDDWNFVYYDLKRKPKNKNNDNDNDNDNKNDNKNENLEV